MNHDMTHDTQQRPAKRATPISQLIPKSNAELNIRSPKQTIKQDKRKHKRPISKDALQSFHSPDKVNNNECRALKKLKKPSATPMPISEIASTPLKFEIHQDQPPKTPPTPKIPMSEIRAKQTLPRPLPTTTTEKLPLQKILDLAQEQPFNDVPMLKAESSNFTSLDLAHDQDSLLYQAQIPFVHLNNWYRITQHLIVEKNLKLRATHEIVTFQRFNEQIFLVDCIRLIDDVEERALLINYRQHPLTSSKLQDIQPGSKISLLEGCKVLGSLKLYKNWKLQI